MQYYTYKINQQIEKLNKVRLAMATGRIATGRKSYYQWLKKYENDISFLLKQSIKLDNKHNPK